MKWILIILSLAAVVGLFVACTKDGVSTPNQELASSVDVERFMGKWYVHGYTPTFLDKNAYDATESYEMREDGKIQTTYQFRKGGHDGKWKTMRPVGWVFDKESGAEWRMRFFGVFTSPYYILYVNSDYTETVIGVPGKDMGWIMSRSPEMSDRDYERLLYELARRDYELDEMQRVRHVKR